MERISKSQLEAVVNRINRLTESPTEPWIKGEDGRYKAQIGCYHLDGAYGGYALHRMFNDGGGVEDVFYGHFSKRELLGKMQAFIAGIMAAKE